MNDSAKKKVIHEYLSQGKRQEAIIYIQEAYSVSYLESHKLLSAIEAEGTYQSSASQTHSRHPPDMGVVVA